MCIRDSHYALLDSGLHEEADRAALRTTWSCDTIYPYYQLSTDKDVQNVTGWLKPDTGKQILSICGERSADIIICPYLFQAEMLHYIPDNLLKIIDLREYDAAVSSQDVKRMRLADVLIVNKDKKLQINELLGEDIAVVLDEDFEKLLSHPKPVSYTHLLRTSRLKCHTSRPTAWRNARTWASCRTTCVMWK